MKFLKIIVLSMFIIGCGQSKEEGKSNSMQSELTRIEQKEVIHNMEIESNFTNAEIAKYTIASIMNQNPETLKVNEKNGIFYVEYKLPDDEKKAEYKIRINGNRIILGNVPGRWRTTKKDEKITFKENENKIAIIQTFADGSNKVKEFSKLP